MNVRHILSMIPFLFILLFATGCHYFPTSQPAPADPSIVDSNFPVDILWISKVHKQIVDQPVIGNSVLVAKTRGMLYAYDIQNGRSRWQRYLNIGYSSPVLVDADTFFVGDGNKMVWALDGRTGEVVWQYVFPNDTTYVGDIVMRDGVLYAATAPKIYVAAIDAASGAEIWRRDDDLGFRGTDLFLNGDELIVAPLGPFRVLNRFTGETVRTVEVREDGALANLQQIYQGRLYNERAVWDANTLELIARLRSPTKKFLGDKCEQFQIPYTFNDHYLYAAGRCGGVFAMDIDNQYKFQWSVFEDTVCSPATSIFDDILYIFTEQGEVVGVDPVTGNVVGRMHVTPKPANIFAGYAGVASNEEMIFLYYGDGNVYGNSYIIALRPTSP